MALDSATSSQYYLPGTFRAELAAQAQRLGFSLQDWTRASVTFTDVAWMEDWMVTMSDGTYLLPTDDARLDAAFNRAQSGDRRFYVLRRKPAEVYDALVRENGLQVQRASVYFDGGNVLSARRADGQAVVITTEGVLRVNMELRDAQGCSPVGATVEVKRAGARDAMAAAFGVPPDRFVVVPQPLLGYDAEGEHLDMAVRPGPNGTVFVDDVDLGNAALAAAATQPELPADTREVMAAYQVDGDQLAGRQVWHRDVTRELTAAGLTTVGVPGYFYADRDSLGEFPGFHPGHEMVLRSAGARQTDFATYFTFMNGLGGRTSAGQRFYLTAASPAWGYDAAPVEHPLAPIETAFRDALARHGVETTFLPSLQHLATQSRGSLDCLTLELESP